MFTLETVEDLDNRIQQVKEWRDLIRYGRDRKNAQVVDVTMRGAVDALQDLLDVLIQLRINKLG